MNIILGILGFILMISLIVLIHEGGHFAMAKAFGVYCHEFSIGMGPALYQKKGKETTYSIRAIPIGGYVMMAGEEESDQDDPEDWQKDVPKERRLDSKPVWQQIIVMVAGVTMNFILAAALIIGYSAFTAQEVIIEPVVESVMENSAADKAGFESGDTILSIEKNNGEIIEPENAQDIQTFLADNKDEAVMVTIESENGSTRTVDITPSYDEEAQRYLMGYTARTSTQPLALGESIQVGIDRLIYMVQSLFGAFGSLFQGQQLDQLSGPIGIYQVTEQSVSAGWDTYLILIALVSLNIGIFNLLPLPALDGGRIVLLLAQKLLGRKIPGKVVTGLISVSFLLLIGIMLFATYNDIARLF